MDDINFSQQSDDYHRIEKAIHFIEEHYPTQPSLDEMAKSAHLSKFHFNRLFKRWAGITPSQFMQYMTLDHTKQLLMDSKSLLETAFEVGLSGPSRLHDLYVTFEAMTPGEFKEKGQGMTISYGFCQSPFGECLLAYTRRGICYMGFVAMGNRTEALDQLFNTWSGSNFTENAVQARTMVTKIFNPDLQKEGQPFHLRVRGTNFQINVWKALLSIPPGQVVSYQDVAACIGKPSAHRAVANAIAINPVAYLIPCHRVIAKSGKIHRYRWGSARKKALIGWEAAQEKDRAKRVHNLKLNT